MKLFSRSRILRGVLTPGEAAAFAAFALGVGSALVAGIHGAHSLADPRMLAGLLLFAPLAVAAAVDAGCHILPDPLLLIASGIALASLPMAEASQALAALATGAGAGAAGWIMNRLTSFGLGDAKLLAVLGLWIGDPVRLLAGVFAALAAAALFSLALMMARRANLKSAIALGPWLCAGGAAAWIAAAPPLA